MPLADADKRREYMRKWNADNRDKTRQYARNFYIRSKPKMEELYKAHGGACIHCGYHMSQGQAALDFHHVIREHKKFHVSLSSHGRSFEALSLEAEKCVLLCANCHRNLHAGVWELDPEIYEAKLALYNMSKDII